MKSSYSNTQDVCVELARAGTTIGIRDSKNPDTPILEFPPPTLTTFIAATKADEFNPLT
jgi:hypothetical protein